VSVDVKNFFYHVTFHSDRLSDIGFMSLSDAAMGIYYLLENMAAKTNNNGSIAVGVDRMSRDMLTDFIMKQFKRSRRDAIKLIDELKDAKFLNISKAGRVTLPKYAYDQVRPKSPGAARQQRFRDKNKNDPGDDEQFPGVSPSFPGPPPAPPSTSDNDFDPDTTGESDTRHPSRRPVTRDGDVTHSKKVEIRDIFISRSRQSSPTRPTTTSTGGAGGGPGRVQPCSVEVLRDLDLFGTDPIELIKTISGERDTKSVRGFMKKLNTVGETIFRQALCEVKDAIFSGHGGNPGRLLHDVANRIFRDGA